MTDAVLAPRRALILGAGLAGAGLVLAACGKSAEADVPAGEVLLRNHAVIGRILVVYREAAALVRANFSSVDAHPIGRAADLWRRFGEVFHAALMEGQVYPAAMKAGGEAAGLVPVLIAQHARARQITQYVLAHTAAGTIAAADADGLVAALESFARMTEAQVAYEATVLIPAWRRGLSAGQLRDAGKTFADFETKTFKADGFAAAVAEIAGIEAALRITGLARYTADAPGAPPQGVIPMPPSLQEGAD